MAQQFAVTGPRYAPSLAGGFAALAALAGGIIAQVGPVDCMIRGGIAYSVGWVAGQVWYVCFAVRNNNSIAKVTEPHHRSDAQELVEGA